VTRPDLRNERGIALVMAVLVLLVLSLLAIVLYTSLTVGRRIVGHDVRENQALNTAEAGVAEALARIRNNEGPDVSQANAPRQVVQIFNAPSGSVPVLGTDSTALATAQPAGQWLNYSTATRSPSALTIQFLTDPAHTVVYRYDSTKNPAIQTATGWPIYKITATGTEGADQRHVVTEAIQKPVFVNADAALTADVGIDFLGTSTVCGYNHRLDTPTGTGVNGDRISPTGCINWEVGSGDKPASWSVGTVTNGGSSVQTSPAMPPNSQNQTGFYSGPWDALSMNQAEFFSWIGSPLSTPPTNPNGVFYLDNNNITQDQSGSFVYPGGNGSGLLYVDGDLNITGTFNYRGLIYIEGDLQINGTVWILGGIICKGKSKIKVANGTCTILYSKDAIEQSIAKFGGQFVNIAWHEGTN
jgi:Tfp pilus assembly protein PilX